MPQRYPMPGRVGSQKRGLSRWDHTEEGEKTGARPYDFFAVTPVYDPIIAVSFAGLVGSLAAMLFLALGRRRELRQRSRVHTSEPTVRMNAVALQALEETLPVSEWHGPLERDVQQLSAMSSSQAGDVIAAREPPVRCPIPA